MQNVRADALAPEACVLRVKNAASPAPQYDLSTTVSAVINFMRPDKSTGTWAADIAYDTATQKLTVSHPYVANDIPVSKLGVWTVYATLTLPAGPIRSKAAQFKLVSPFSTSD